MKNLDYPFKCLLISVLLLTIYSCSRQKDGNDIIVQAESIVEQQPDSALRLLNTVLFPEKLNKSRYNKFNLIMLEAKDKSYKDITSDTVIFAVKDYYLKNKDYPNAALAAFYSGRIWHERNDITKAIEAYSEAEKLADKTGNYNLIGLIQANWGILHREHSSYGKAIELNKKAVEMYNKAKNYRNEIGALRLIGDCFALSDKADSAFYYYNESLKLSNLYTIPELQSDIKQSMGVTYREEGLYEQAEKLFNEALALSKDSVEQARILLNIAQVYVLKDIPDSINFYLDKALVLSSNDPWLLRFSYLLRSNVAEDNNRYREALKYYKEFYQQTENVFDSEKNNKILEIQGKYDFEKLKNVKNQLIIKQQEALNIFSLVSLGICIIAFAYYRRYVQNKRRLLETEQKIESLQKSADRYSNIESSFRKILLKYIGILRKTALLGIEFDETKQDGEKKLLKKINNIVYEQDKWNWDQLYRTMNDARDGLYGNIRIKYPQLNELEFRICCLTCETDFSDKEMEAILGTTINMVRRIRSDLRKKFGMSKREDFLVFFEKTIQ